LVKLLRPCNAEVVNVLLFPNTRFTDRPLASAEQQGLFLKAGRPFLVLDCKKKKVAIPCPALAGQPGYLGLALTPCPLLAEGCLALSHIPAAAQVDSQSEGEGLSAKARVVPNPELRGQYCQELCNQELNWNHI
jgi:hypothetical protein